MLCQTAARALVWALCVTGHVVYALSFADTSLTALSWILDNSRGFGSKDVPRSPGPEALSIGPNLASMNRFCSAEEPEQTVVLSDNEETASNRFKARRFFQQL
jgi:hypothetical protein